MNPGVARVRGSFGESILPVKSVCRVSTWGGTKKEVHGRTNLPVKVDRKSPGEQK